VAPERINRVKNPSFELIKQQSLRQEIPTFVAQQTNLFSHFIVVVIHVPPINGDSGTKCIMNTVTQFHDGDDVIIHIGRLTKVCVMNGEDIDAHKL